MPANTTAPVQIQGFKETLRVIGKLDSTLRKQFTREFKHAVAPLVEAAQANVPSQPPLSGMEANWNGKPGWDTGKEEARIKIKLDSRRVRRSSFRTGVQYEVVGSLSVRASGRGLAVFDMAGRRNPRGKTEAGARLIDRLNGRFRSPSRAMWPATDETFHVILNNCVPIVRRAEAEAQRLLNTPGLGG